MLECHLHLYIFLGSLAVDDILVQRRLARVEILDELLDASLIAEAVTSSFSSLICQRYAKSLCEKCSLSKAHHEGIVVVYRILKYRIIREKCDLCSCLFPVLISSYNIKRLHRLTLFKAHMVDAAVLEDPYLKPVGQGIDYRCAYSVQTSRYLISSSAELAACVQYGKYYLQSRLSRLLLYIYRDSSSVVAHGDRIVLMDSYLDMCTEARQCLIDGIVHDLIYQMMETARGSRPYIHTGSAPDRLKSFEYLYLFRIVFRTHLFLHISTGEHPQRFPLSPCISCLPSVRLLYIPQYPYR